MRIVIEGHQFGYDRAREQQWRMGQRHGLLQLTRQFLDDQARAEYRSLKEPVKAKDHRTLAQIADLCYAHGTIGNDGP
jgi:hypothetical protein